MQFINLFFYFFLVVSPLLDSFHCSYYSFQDCYSINCYSIENLNFHLTLMLLLRKTKIKKELVHRQWCYNYPFLLFAKALVESVKMIYMIFFSLSSIQVSIFLALFNDSTLAFFFLLLLNMFLLLGDNCITYII